MGHVPTLSEIKQRQQRAWATGDYAVVAGRTALIAEMLCDAADLHAGTSVLDVATGSGNAAIAAARHGCAVTGLDYVPRLLECGRVRARAEGFDVRFVEGDAESLPFDDGEFDAVLSCLGVMFAPDQRRAAASCCGSAVPAAPSRCHVGRPTASSPSSSAPRTGTPRRRPAHRGRSAGERSPTSWICWPTAWTPWSPSGGPSRSASRRRRPWWTSSAPTTGRPYPSPPC